MTAEAKTRRGLLRRTVVAAGLAAPLRPALAQQTAGRVVVIGGGFAGATCARTLKGIDPQKASTRALK
jgi:heterodisulfide reductase subunit A-like polyferredoxin